MDINIALTLSKKLAVAAGLKIMEIYNQDFDVEYKEDTSPLTLADKTANDIILAGLRARFPDTAYLSEEEKDNKERLLATYCFIIDPLDGTKEFVKKNGEFTVNIALVKNGKPVMGVIYAPYLKDLYYASVDDGAYYKAYGEDPVSICVTNEITDLLLVGSKSHRSEKLDVLINKNSDKIADLVSCGSSLKGCMVARGQADIYYRFGLTCEWDTCAMQCICECAGAIVMQMDRTRLNYNRENILNEKGFFIVNKPENIFI